MRGSAREREIENGSRGKRLFPEWQYHFPFLIARRRRRRLIANSRQHTPPHARGVSYISVCIERYARSAGYKSTASLICQGVLYAGIFRVVRSCAFRETSNNLNEYDAHVRRLPNERFISLHAALGRRSVRNVARAFPGTVLYTCVGMCVHVWKKEEEVGACRRTRRALRNVVTKVIKVFFYLLILYSCLFLFIKKSMVSTL